MFKVNASHPMIYVYNLNRAVEFYTKKLGFEVRFHIPEAFASLFLKEANIRVDLHPTSAEDLKNVGFGPIIYFDSKDFDKTFEYLKSQNIKVAEPRREGDSPRFATFWDSEGNALGLEEY
jgi:catechol 2,3-dioxygenase-like lactoylglutathione lyase family enzyme